ncbi:MAG: MFS transporter [Gammaproteobacteria bacterium]
MQKALYGSLVWILATLFVVYSFSLNTAAAVFSASIKTSFGINNLGVTLALAAFIVGFACMQIPAGYLLDRFNARYVMSSGVFILSLGSLLISFSDNLFLFAIANFAQGIGASFAFIGAGKLISQWFAPNMFPILFGITEAISCIGAGILHSVFVMELHNHSWNTIYQALAVFGFILFILTIIVVKSPASEMKANQTISLIDSLKTVCKNSQLWLCALTAATSFGVLLVYASFWYMPIQEFYSVVQTQALIISGMVFVGIGIGLPFLSWLSNRMQSRKLILHVSLVVGAMTVLLGIYLPHYQINTLIIIKIVSFLIGFSLSGSMLLFTVVSELSSDSTRGVALGIINSSVFLFNTFLMFIPLLFMTAFSQTFLTYLWVLPFCILIAILFLYFIKETYQS